MPVSQALNVKRGRPAPLGPIILDGGVNFSLYTKEAASISLNLFEFNSNDNLVQPMASIALDPQKNRTGNAWHVFVENLPDKVLYGYVIDNSDLLLDPYAPEIWSGADWGRPNTLFQEQKRFYSPLGLINLSSSFDWEDDVNPEIPLRDLVIYELHVRGFTAHSGSATRYPGTYSALVEKIPYLKNLGINAVELMPIFEFNELSYCRSWIQSRNTLLNYWGYSPVSFFAPMNRFSASREPGGASEELKTLVKELHKNGIEVLLDVVYNHTGESKESAYSYRGLGRQSYYMINGENHDQNFTGCGHTFNSNHPIARELIISSLRQWVSEYHVDGFRFDLASALTRNTNGEPMDQPPLIQSANADPILSKVKLIAEPWDAAGLYHVGNFPFHEGRWAEWNGKYRDDIRDFIKGTERKKEAFASRICGSEDLYHFQRFPASSINFVTCHDGFTLCDLVSYNNKHNEANGEDNRDGSDDNRSWNCGHEGKTKISSVLKLRERQMKNFIAALMLSQGVPMIRMGDEYGHTQEGNNNTWCQDNHLSWFNWHHADMTKPFTCFFKSLINFRRQNKLLRQSHFLSPKDIRWHGTKPLSPIWNNDDRFVAWTLIDPDNEENLYIAFNASYRRKKLIIPKPPENKLWYKIIDTFQSSPDDFIPEEAAEPFKEWEHPIMPYSMLLFKAK